MLLSLKWFVVRNLRRKERRFWRKFFRILQNLVWNIEKALRVQYFWKKNLWVIKMEYSLSSIFRDSSRNPCINYSESILPGSSPEISSSSRNCGIKTFSNSTLISHRCDCYENCSSNKVTHGNSISSFATL